jgi:DNA-binding IclR family transcriptional regulator
MKIVIRTGREQRRMTDTPFKITSLKRAADIFAVLKAHEPTSVDVIVGETGMPKSTVYGYLQTLQRLGYVHKLDTERYRLGLGLTELGETAKNNRNLIPLADTHVDDLAADVGQHVNLVMEENGMAYVVYLATGENAVTIDTHVGLRVPLHACAAGKAILAEMTDQRRDTVFERHGLESYTENTIGDRQRLDAQLESIRERGYAIDDEERIEGVRSIGEYIENPWIHAAVSVSGPAMKFTDDVLAEELAAKLAETVNMIEVSFQHG